MANESGGAPLLTVRHGYIGSGVSGKCLQIESVDYSVGIEGVEVGRQFADCEAERRDLTLCYNRDTPPGVLGYVVTLRPGGYAGNHYHHKRGEKVILCGGRAYFRIQDQRPTSPTFGQVACFHLSVIGTTVYLPPGVAHSIGAAEVGAVIFVAADYDFDPNDDVHTALAGLVEGGPNSS